MVVDPFAGGGSIPLESLRVGTDAFASDLNPIAVLLNKALLEYIPKFGTKIADELLRWGNWVKFHAENELRKFYPLDEDGSIPIAYLWARTIICEGPNCGSEIPLMRSLWLSKRKNRNIALKLIPKPNEKRCDFEIIENVKPEDVGDGTVKRSSATCPCCGYTNPVNSVRNQMKKTNGGINKARMFVVVLIKNDKSGRFYRIATEKDIIAASQASMELKKRYQKKNNEMSIIPQEPYPDETASGALSSSVLFGPKVWSDIYTPRQLLALTTIVKFINESEKELVKEFDQEFSIVIKTFLAFALDRQADYLTSLTIWANSGEFIAHTFGRQALPFVWEWPECNLWADGSGNWDGAINWIFRVITANALDFQNKGHAEQASATSHPLPNDSADIFFTDPPYYDAIAYGDLSDFFYVWLKRTVSSSYPNLFNKQLVDKSDEIVHLSKRYKGPYAHKTKEFFQQKMQIAMSDGRRILTPNGIGIIVFAHKSTSGWEAQLNAMINAGWIITASWSIDTERTTRMNALGASSLASSVHLVCRPRENPDGSLRIDDIGDWRDILSELPKRIHEWLPRLAEEGVVGADAIFACLGPALEIFSRYSSVEKASGKKVELKEYLEHVWAAVSHEALSMIFEGADASGFEEDARLTAMWLWTLRTSTQNGSEAEEDNDKTKSLTGYSLEYDAARKIAQGLGAHLESLGHLVQTKGDKATLLAAGSRAQYLFGKDAGDAPKKKSKKKAKQLSLFEELEEESEDWFGEFKGQPGKTILDQLHQSMILFGAGRGEALKRFLVEEGVGRNALFWRLAQSLSALYPSGTEEKRWVDGVLARKKGLGL
jgi:adenine-specific DNA methylase